jgi:hypothetical protein
MLQDKSIKIKTKTKDCVLLKVFLEIVWNHRNNYYYCVTNQSQKIKTKKKL